MVLFLQSIVIPLANIMIMDNPVPVLFIFIFYYAFRLCAICERRGQKITFLYQLWDKEYTLNICYFSL